MDALLRSAAVAYGPIAEKVVLTGLFCDSTD